MKVLVVHWGKRGAGPQIALSVATALRDIGHEALVSYSTGSEIADSFESFGSGYALRTYDSVRESLTGLPRAVSMAVRIRRDANRGAIDGVYATMPSLWQPILALALRGTTVPYIASMHDVVRHSGEESRLLSTVEQAELKLADGVILYSRASELAARSIGWLSRRPRWLTALGTSVPQAAVDRLARQRTLPVDTVRIGMFGRIEKYKGTELGLDAVDELVRRGHQASADVWGSGDPTILRRLKSRGNCRLESGWVEESRVADVLDKFDIALFPYLDASQSGVLPSVAALGIPSVVTPRGALPEVVTDRRCGVVAADATATDLADAIEQLLDPQRYAEVSRSALTNSQENYWTQTARTVVRAIADSI